MTRGWLPRRFEWLALIVGVLALFACLMLGFIDPHQTLLSYLTAYVFWLGLTLGSLAMLMVHALTGGAWGWYVRPQLLAAARALPMLALLALPILLGVHTLYVWAQPAALAHDAQLRAQTWYLDTMFFVIRAIVYFALWLALWLGVERMLAVPERQAYLPRLAGPGMIVYAVSMLLASTDWIMSLTPHWHSSIYGMTIVTGQMLSATALAAWCATRASDAIDAHPPKLLHDLGNLLLMFVLTWMYLAFMQYLTIWVADLPVETSWYIPRTLTSWRWLAWFLIAFLFVVPFALLLSRRAKRARAWLGGVSALLLIAMLADALWLVVPNFRAAGFSLRWTDPLAALGVGGLWAAVFLGQLRIVRLPGSSLPAAALARIETEHVHG